MKRKREKSVWKVLTCFAVTVVCLFMVGSFSAEVMAAPDPNGNFLPEWKTAEMFNGNDPISKWSVMRGNGGYYFYIEGQDWLNGGFNFNYGNVVFDWSREGEQARSEKYYASQAFYFERDVIRTNAVGAAADSYVVNDNGTVRYEQIYVPDDFFFSDSFTISFSGSSINTADIVALDGAWESGNDSSQQETVTEPETTTEPETVTEPETTTEPETVTEPETTAAESVKEDVNAIYSGIVIDGNFSDWDGVIKSPVSESDGFGVVTEAAMVWDGDYVYIYMQTKGPNWNTVTWTGTWSNGLFIITSDLDRTTVFQIKANGSVPEIGGVDGAMIAVDSCVWGNDFYNWEIAIPSDQLPRYINTISLGWNYGPTMISDIANLQATEEDGNRTVSNGDGIVYDGNYGDWEDYPHAVIAYELHADSGKGLTDAECALYSDGSHLYCHVTTPWPKHMQQNGVEFKDLKVRINGNDIFYCRYIDVDQNGNINWDWNLEGLPMGTSELMIVDNSGWSNATNLNDERIQDINKNAIYGGIYITRGNVKDEAEVILDLGMIADRLGMDADDIKTIEVNFVNIGDDWIRIAGTPTGALIGVPVCIAIATGGGYAFYNRKKKRTA